MERIVEASNGTELICKNLLIQVAFQIIQNNLNIYKD